MRSAVVLLLASIAVVTASVVESETDIPVMIPRASDPPALVTAFTARGGKAAELETTTLLIGGRAAARITRVDGSMGGKNAEFTLTLAAVTKPVREWLRSFVSGKFKKRDLAIITKTAGTGAGSNPFKPLEYTKYSFSGVLIRELIFPSFGVAGGSFKVRVLAQSSDESKNVKQIAASDAGGFVRSQFFKLDFNQTKSKKHKEKSAASAKAMGKSVYKIDSFSLTRGQGFGQMDTTHITAYFPSASDKGAVLHDWTRWYTRRETTYAGNGGTTSSPRDAKLTIYYWTGSSMDLTAGESSHGALKVLFTVDLKEVRLDRLDAGDGKAIMTVGKLEMSKQ